MLEIPLSLHSLFRSPENPHLWSLREHIPHPQQQHLFFRVGALAAGLSRAPPLFFFFYPSLRLPGMKRGGERREWQ